MNLTDQNYWVSLGWTAMPGVAVALLCLVIPLLYFMMRCCCSVCRKSVNCCPGPNPRGHSRSEVKLLKGVILFFALIGLVGAVVLFGSAPQAASGVEKLTLDMVGQTDILMNNFTQVLDAVDNAVALLQSAEDTQASNSQTQTLKANLNSVSDSTAKFEQDVVDIFEQVKTILIAIAGGLFALVLLIFIVNFFQVRILLFLFIMLIPLFAAVTWLAFGATFLLNAFVYDLCVGAETELQEPGHDGPLTQYIPCPDPASVDNSFNEVYQQANDLSFTMNAVVNGVNAGLEALGSEDRMSNFCEPYYPTECAFQTEDPDNISACPNRGPSYPSGTYESTQTFAQGGRCADGELEFTTDEDFEGEWISFKCVNPSDKDSLTSECESEGKFLTENDFDKLVKSASGISLLLLSLEKLKSFAKCEFVDSTMHAISHANCPSLTSGGLTGMWISFILIGLSFMALFWLTIIGQARYKGLTQRNMETEMIARKSTQGSMDAGYLA